MAVANTQAYWNTTKITAVKSFIVQAIVLAPTMHSPQTSNSIIRLLDI
jgi:hypothetical protein